MQPNVKAFFDTITNTISYVASDPDSGAAVIIDPVLDYSSNDARIYYQGADEILAYVKEQNLEIIYILETHAHADHLTAAQYLHEKTGAPVIIGAHIVDVQRKFAPIFEADDLPLDGSDFQQLVTEEDELQLGSFAIKIVHTPGHTPACVTYLIGDAAFVGDTLFMPDYGTARADFPGGDAATLYQSIQKIFALPDETRIFVCHDYLPEGRSEYAWESSVAEQKADNIHVHNGIDEATFVAMRTARDITLDAPKLILPSLQVNIRGGHIPTSPVSGRMVLHLPVNAI